MATVAPKTISETRQRMQEAVRQFRGQACKVAMAERARLADRARRAIERLRKQFKGKIDNMLRRDAKRHWGINDGERQGLEKQLRLATDGALKELYAASEPLNSEETV